MHLARSRLSANNNLTSKGPSGPSGRVQGNQGNVTWKSGSVASPLCCSSTFRKITAMASLVQFSNGMVQIVVNEKKSHGGDPFIILFFFSFSIIHLWFNSMMSSYVIAPKYSDNVYLWLGRNLMEKIIRIRGYVLFSFFFFETVTVMRSRILIIELELTIVKD